MAVQWLFLSADCPFPVPAHYQHGALSVEWRLARRGLPFFLVSNACTGLVNVAIDTMRLGDGPAVAILVAYLHVCVLATLLYDRCRGQGEGGRQQLQPMKQHLG